MRAPRSSTYRVKRGDCLWNIAKAQYGNALLWTHIAKANRIGNPRRLFIGIDLTLPVIHDDSPGLAHHLHAPTHPPVNELPPEYSGHAPVHAAAAAEPSSGTAPKDSLLPAMPVTFPAVKYKFDDWPATTVDTPEFTITLRPIGEVSLQRKGVMAEIEFTRNGMLSEKLKAEYRSRFTTLAGQFKARFNPVTRTVDFSCGLTTTMKDAKGGVISSTQYEFTPPNRFKFSFRPREVQGETGDMIYKGVVGFEVEVVVKGERPSGPDAIPVRSPQPVSSETLRWVIVGGLVVAGVAIIVADIGKDVATLGAGAVESPVSFAAAAALFEQAAVMAH